MDKKKKHKTTKRKALIDIYRGPSLPIQASTTFLSLRHDRQRKAHKYTIVFIIRRQFHIRSHLQRYSDVTHVLLGGLNLLSLLWDQGLRRQLPPGNRNNMYTLQRSPLTFKAGRQKYVSAWIVTLSPLTPLVPAEPWKTKY